MQSNADVVFRDVDQSPALAFTIHKKLEKLNRFSDQIIRSRVVVESPHNHKSKGKLFRASIELGVAGAPLSISQDDSSAHKAVRNAFNAAERKLKEVSNRKRLHS